MKKVLLALFLMFGFASAGFSADFTITDESGTPPQSGILRILELNIPTGSGHQYYSVNVTDFPSDRTVFFTNISQGNILLRFNAGVTSKKQAVFKVGRQNDFSNSDYYALSSCEVDKNPQNRPTR